jgi:hypothetical protein
MDKQDWIERLNRMQYESNAFRKLTDAQREAISEAIEALRSATQSLGENFDLDLSDCRAIDTAFWKMRNAFENIEPSEWQLNEMDAHNLDWDFENHRWIDATPSDETVDDWHPHGV